jgi:hypothetical protein
VWESFDEKAWKRGRRSWRKMCDEVLHKLNSKSNIAGVNDLSEMSVYVKYRGNKKKSARFLLKILGE